MNYTSKTIRKFEKQIISIEYTSYCKGKSWNRTRTGTLSKINDDDIEMNFFGFLYNSKIEYRHIIDIEILQYTEVFKSKY